MVLWVLDLGMHICWSIALRHLFLGRYINMCGIWKGGIPDMCVEYYAKL